MQFQKIYRHLASRKMKYVYAVVLILLLIIASVVDKSKFSKAQIGEQTSYSILKSYHSKKDMYDLEIRRVELLDTLDSTRVSYKVPKDTKLIRVTYRIKSDHAHPNLPATLFSLKVGNATYKESFLLNSISTHILLDQDNIKSHAALSQQQASSYITTDFESYDLHSLFEIPFSKGEPILMEFENKSYDIFKGSTTH